MAEGCAECRGKGVGERVLVILNPAAGREDKESLAPQIVRQFALLGLDAQVLPVGGTDDLVEVARRALRDSVRAVVAAGGDGTVGTVASVLAGSGMALGILPVGTLNHFARDLRVPTDVEAAIRTIAAGRVAAVDVCEVNGRVFINNSSLGLYPMMVEEREWRERLGHRRWPAFLWAAAMALRRYPFLALRFRVDGQEIIRQTPFVFIGNNVYQVAGLHIGLRSTLRDGQMCVYLLHHTGRWGLVRLSLSALMGRLHRAPHFESFGAGEVCIDSRRRRLKVALDGEVIPMAPPLDYRVRPGALRVFLPGE